MQCGIQWVCKESNWKPTPDDNNAVALAKLDKACDPKPIPICQEHLNMARRDQLEKHGWSFETIDQISVPPQYKPMWIDYINSLK